VICRGKGDAVALIGSGRLRAGEVEAFDVVLYANTRYTVQVRPDQPDVDFDLRVYDQNGNLVQWGESADSEATVEVTPRWTGSFRIFVICATGASGYQVLISQ
jgi:hypothetical protein